MYAMCVPIFKFIVVNTWLILAPARKVYRPEKFEIGLSWAL